MAGLFECFRTFKNSFPNSPENQQALVIVYSPEQPKLSFMLGQLFQAQSPSLCQQQLLFVENHQVTLIKACLTSPFSCLKSSVLLPSSKRTVYLRPFPPGDCPLMHILWLPSGGHLFQRRPVPKMLPRCPLLLPVPRPPMSSLFSTALLCVSKFSFKF